MADVEVAIGVGGPIVKNELVIGGSVRLLPFVVIVGRSLNILLLELGQWSRSRQAKKFSKNTDTRSYSRKVAYGNVDFGSLRVAVHFFDMTTSGSWRGRST